jgi:hypothetical protein
MRSFKMNFLTNCISAIVVVGVILLVAGDGYSQKKGKEKKEETYVMTEGQLQSHIMGFADRFAAYLIQGFESYDETEPPPENRRIAQAGFQLNSLVDSLNRFLDSPGVAKLMPQIKEAISAAGNKGEDLIDHTFRQAALLIFIWFVAYIIARLLVNYFSKMKGDART